jgi:hypothetical protein
MARRSVLVPPALSITCDAAAPDAIVVKYSASVNQQTAGDAANYKVTLFTGPGASNKALQLGGIANVQLDSNNTTALITLDQRAPNPLTLSGGQWIQVEVLNVAAPNAPNPFAFTQVRDVGDALGNIATSAGNIATNTGSTSRSVEDLAAFSLLTEEIGYPPSPLARPSGVGGAAAPSGGTLGQIATKAISDVLGWQAKTDPKGFQGALTAAFKLEEEEGVTKAIWTPRTYAIQTDLSGGITGAQASVYKRAKDALDQSLPLLDGLYPLFKEAKDEDVAALRATVRTQFTDLVNETGQLGGPRIARVTQLFFLLLGQQLPQQASAVQGFVTGQPGSGGPLATDPDRISGSLGNLRSLFGFGKDDDQVNTVEDEQDLTNFRIVSDYVTSLAQSWLNNLSFFGLQTQTPFYGTQLVLLTRQLSVIAESVNEVRFTLDSVFIGPAERQTLQINFLSPPAPIGTPPMFFEDLLTWIDSFASEEGPRLIQDGGKLAVGGSFVPIGTQLQTLVAGAVTPANASSLPRGYKTARVRRSLEELRDQLQELVNLAAPIQHIATPEPQPELAVLGINPSVVFFSALPASKQAIVTIIGTGLDSGGTMSVAFTATAPSQNASHIGVDGSFGSGTAKILSDNLAFVTLDLNQIVTAPGPNDLGPYTVTVTMTNPNQLPPPAPVTLVTGFTIQP